jgi:CheY-like chemotaxis protein
MPVMSGEEAFAHIRRINANVPIIVTSGYMEGAAEDLFKSEEQPTGFIQKPFTVQKLTEVIRHALN